MTGVIEPFPYQNQQFQLNEKLLYDTKIIGMSLLIDGQREESGEMEFSDSFFYGFYYFTN